MDDMKPEDVVGQCREVVQSLFQQETRKLLVNDEEVPYPDGCLIVSRTDLDGNITHCNQSFVDMSGYSKEELVGQPQSLLRHPDLPSAAYADMWKTIQQGQRWQGYIKNLRKDGRFYWVYATVVANVRGGEVLGYTSVRRKPSRDKINQALTQYEAMKQA